MIKRDPRIKKETNSKSPNYVTRSTALYFQNIQVPPLLNRNSTRKIRIEDHQYI